MNIMISGCREDISLCRNYINFYEDINVVGLTSTNEKTIEKYYEKNPDVLLIDTTSDNLNSLYVISKLSEYDNEIMNKVILVIDPNQYNLFNSNQIPRIIQKPITPAKVYDSLINIQTKSSSQITAQDVKKILLKLKIDLYSKGVYYLIEAILMAAEKQTLLQNLQDIYEVIGKKNNIPYEKVKWSIRSTIDTINRYTDTQVLKSVFKYYDENRVLTPKYFIKLVLYLFDIDTNEEP